tara:strand:- start:52 stop:276 length:225 start_codon:yes stop_codon:yes gene_type:complete
MARTLVVLLMILTTAHYIQGFRILPLLGLLMLSIPLVITSKELEWINKISWNVIIIAITQLIGIAAIMWYVIFG